MTAEWIIAGCAVLTLLGAIVFWAYGTFQTKSEAKQFSDESKERHDAFQKETRDRHSALEGWVQRQDTTLQRVAQDVSYIRGRLEK